MIGQAKIMRVRKYLIGAGAGTAVGGLIGVLVLPLSWLTLVFGVCIPVGAYISRAVYKEFYP